MKAVVVGDVELFGRVARHVVGLGRQYGGGHMAVVGQVFEPQGIAVTVEQGVIEIEERKRHWV